eukprot:scaffold5226_cov100-Isochrysis_galbana.AAC.5
MVAAVVMAAAHRAATDRGAPCCRESGGRQGWIRLQLKSALRPDDQRARGCGPGCLARPIPM